MTLIIFNITNMDLSFIEDEGLRALIGSVLLVGTWVLCLVCVYKYVSKTKVNQPRVYTSVEVRSTNSGLIVLPIN